MLNAFKRIKENVNEPELAMFFIDYYTNKYHNESVEMYLSTSFYTPV